MQTVSSAWKEKQELNFVPESFVQIEVKLSNGMSVTFSKDKIMSYEHTVEVDLLAGNIGKSQITFVLDNSDGMWDATNPTNVARFLAQSSKVTVKYGLDVGVNSPEWIKGGVFFLSEWDTPSNGIEASFTATSAFSYMTDTYTGIRTGTLLQIATAAAMQNRLPNGEYVPFAFDNSLGNITVDFSQDDTDYSCAEILQMIANTVCCVMYYDRNGKIHIEPLLKTMTDYVISKMKSYQYPEYTLSQEIKNIEITYASGKTTVNISDTGNTQTVSNALIPTQSQAHQVAIWTANMISGRKTLKSSFRADPRLDVLDRVTVEHKSGLDSVAVVTSVKYTFKGAWEATFEGRILDPFAAAGNSGENYAMGYGDIIFTTQEMK